MSFGSPVTDFLQDVPRQNKAIEPIPPDISREDERGFLDHLIDVTDGYSRIAGIAEGITEDLSVMNGATHASTKDLEKINANPSESSPRAARKIARKLAEHIARFKNRLKIANAEYASIAQDTENSLEFMLSFQLNQSEVINPEIHKQLSSLRNLLSTVIGARNSCLGMAEKMDEVPRIERRLNRELGQGSEEIRVMANNLDKTIASISRALNLHA